MNKLSTILTVSGFVVLAYFTASTMNKVSNIEKVMDGKPVVSGSATTSSMEKFIMDNPQVIVSSLESFQQQMQAQQIEAQKQVVLQNMDKVYSDNSIVIGNPDAEIKLVEFFDFNCGYCKQAAIIINKLVEENPNVKVYMKDLPILNESSLEAAKASVAAGLLGKYKEFNLGLFSYLGDYNEEAFRKIATEIGLNPNELVEMMNSQKVLDILNENRIAASIVGLQGTPTVLIEEEMYIGPLSREGLDEVIRARLEKSIK